MRFSLFQLPCYRPGFAASWAAFYGDMIEQAALVDRAGWERIYVSEHHFHYYGGAVPNPAMMLLALGNATKRIRLAAGISLLPFHHPLKLAEDYAMADQLTGGRIDFGVGRGYLPHEFGGFSIPPDEQQARFDEVFEVVRRAWTGEAFAHHGRFFQFDKLAVLPTPMQKAVPVLVAAVRTRESFEFAGRNGFGLMMNRYSLTDEQLETGFGWYKAALAAAGHDLAGRPVMVAHMTHIADTTEQAMAEAHVPLREHMHGVARLRTNNVFYTDFTGTDEIYAQPGAPEKDAREFMLNRTLVGDPERVAAQLRRYADMGFNEVAFVNRFGALTGAQSRRTLERLESEVRPRLGLTSPSQSTKVA